MISQGWPAVLVRGSVPAPDERAARLSTPGGLTRVVARVRGRTLDRALIEGADPAASTQLATRAAQLTRQSTRAEIADGLERLARTASQAPSRRRVLPFRRAVLANEDELRALAARLRAPGPLYAQGLAMLRELLVDGAGPAYTDRQGSALARELRNARVAIGG